MAQWDNSNQEFNFKKIIPIGIGVLALILVISFWSQMTVTIDSGRAGVIFERFTGGLDKETVYDDGFHFKAPWNDMIVYNVRQQEISEVMNVLSSNGLEIKVDVSLWFRPEYNNLGNLHDQIGESYIQSIVVPAVRSSARTVVGRYTPEEIYATKRDAISEEIYAETDTILQDKFVNVVRILIRSIVLPPTIKSAIETKLKQEQETLEYEFRLAKAKKEAERQEIEARGKAKANEIISQSLTDKILKEKGIEATLKLANSSNSKVVVVGGGGDGLPLILGNQ